MKKLLIANRGEIACRIIKTARRLGWQTVAVFSSADKNARHVSLSDESYLIGDPPPSESYLNYRHILEIATEARVTAIHPGYGFLAEDPEFAAACINNHMIFVGPSEGAISAMGRKGFARQKMQAAGVRVLPGINKVTSSTTDSEIADLGYPILIKPEAGGGGKGMKIVYQPESLRASLDAAAREAQAFFENDNLMIEKYLLKPRHIEIQIFADQFGHCIHLNERDCSLQRRHQKIVEESPAPNFSDQLRQMMGQTAIEAARAINYVGAGTVEFLLDEDDQFYFMEMNTRLQVEHAVTEMITGLDLVEWQLNIAMGGELPSRQQDIKVSGHAIEVRIYAEDPLNDFLPASGRITHLRLPDVHSGLRIDSGISCFDQVSVFYDPMLMKLISWAKNRHQCIGQLAIAISELEIAGVRTNRDFLQNLISHPTFQDGGLATDYLDDHLGEILKPLDDENLHIAICAVAIYLVRGENDESRLRVQSPWFSETSFRINAPAVTRLSLEIGQQLISLEIETTGNQFIVSALNLTSICTANLKGPRLELTRNQSLYPYQIHRNHDTITLFSNNQTFEFRLPDEDILDADDEGSLQAPMAGKIVAILVTAGTHVKKGAPLAIIEAMKMEHTLKAPASGTVVEVYFSESDLVDEGIALFDFETDQS